MNPVEEQLVYKRALDWWGRTAQLDQCVEECAELIQAINKYKRGHVVDGLVDELADVHVMINQLAILVGRDKVGERVDFKLKRLATKLDIYKEWEHQAAPAPEIKPLPGTQGVIDLAKPRKGKLQCPKCRGDYYDEWVCIQEGAAFGYHVLRCGQCHHEEKVKP